MIVRPVPVETAGGVPKRVEEIEAALFRRLSERPLETRQRMQRRRGGEQIWNWRLRHREEASLRVHPFVQPIADTARDRHPKLMEQGDRGGRRIDRADLHAAC